MKLFAFNDIVVELKYVDSVDMENSEDMNDMVWRIICTELDLSNSNSI